MDAVWLIVIVAAVMALYIAAKRAITIADLAVEDGSVRVVRGGLTPPVLADLRDVARSPVIRSARIRILRSDGHAEVRLSGDLSPEQAQRIRNVVGSVPFARLINAPKRR